MVIYQFMLSVPNVYMKKTRGRHIPGNDRFRGNFDEQQFQETAGRVSVFMSQA
jgi:hypothetical protein